MFDISTINVFIGWIVGMFTRSIISIVKKWTDKRNFKKILKRDVRLRVNHLKSIEKRIIDSLDARTLDDALIKLIEMGLRYHPKIGKEIIRDNGTFEGIENVSDKISTDFYKKNYEKILDYFDNKSNVISFYERLTTLNSMVDLMKEDDEKGIRFFEGYLLTYLGQLKCALDEGKNLSDL